MPLLQIGKAGLQVDHGGRKGRSGKVIEEIGASYDLLANLNVFCTETVGPERVLARFGSHRQSATHDHASFAVSRIITRSQSTAYAARRISGSASRLLDPWVMTSSESPVTITCATMKGHILAFKWDATVLLSRRT